MQGDIINIDSLASSTVRENKSNKPPLLFLHGYLSSKESFAYQYGFFNKFFDVYAFDLKGFGENKNMPYPYSLDDYVAEVKEFIKKNNLIRPSVIAHSFGGRIAIKLAGNEPTFFDKIVLTGSAGIKPKPSVKRVIKKWLFFICKPFLHGKKPKFFYSKDYLSVSGVMRKSFSLIVGEHLNSCAKKITNETLVVVGEKDKETPPYMAKKLHKFIKNSKLLTIKNAGHFAFIDSPLKFNWEVKKFLVDYE